MAALRSIVATILFALLTIILSVLSVPAAALDRSGKTYLALARLWSKGFLALYGIKVSLSGLANIPTSGQGKVYIVNHSSYADIPVVLASIPDDIRIVLRRSLTRIPIWGWALAVSPFITIDRASAASAQESIEVAAEAIRRGASILLFPEGTRTPNGEMQPFKRGAFRLAFSSRSTIIPVALQGTFEVLNRNQKLPRCNQCVTVTVGPALLPTVSDKSARDQEIALMKQSEEALKALLAHS